MSERSVRDGAVRLVVGAVLVLLMAPIDSVEADESGVKRVVTDTPQLRVTLPARPPQTPEQQALAAIQERMRRQVLALRERMAGLDARSARALERQVAEIKLSGRIQLLLTTAEFARRRGDVQRELQVLEMVKRLQNPRPAPAADQSPGASKAK